MVPEDEGFASRALAEARRTLDQARVAVANADDAWFFPRYDAALCQAARDAVANARRRRDAARLLREAYGTGSPEAEQGLLAARTALDAAAPWVAVGLVDSADTMRLEQLRARVDERRTALTVTRAELEAAGWDVPPSEPKVAALATAPEVAAGLLNEAKALSDAIVAAAIQRCTRGNTRGVAVMGARSFKDWMILTGLAGSTRAALFYAFHPEDRTCQFAEKALVRARGVFPDDGDETLHTWTAVRAVPVPLLFGWTPRGAWFVTRDGGWWTFTHNTGPDCPIAQAGCGAPTITARDVVARCPCGASTDPGGMQERKVRYAWDGGAVIVED